MTVQRLASLLLLTALSATDAVAWDPIRDLTGKRLDEHAGSLAKSVDSFRHAPLKYTEQRFRELTGSICAAPSDQIYIRSLTSQARGRWQGLPDWMRTDAMKRRYPHVDLDKVIYAQGIGRIINASALTYGHEIFIKRRIDLERNDDDVWLMLHELEHAQQYAKRGSKNQFQCEYWLKAVGKGIEHGTLDVHGRIDMEKAADRKADSVLGLAIRERDDAMYGTRSYRRADTGLSIRGDRPVVFRGRASVTRDGYVQPSSRTATRGTRQPEESRGRSGSSGSVILGR
jgi:hypothetical protein